MLDYLRIAKAWTIGILTLFLVPLCSFAGVVYGNTRHPGGKALFKERSEEASTLPANAKPHKGEIVFLLHGLMRNNQDMMLLQKEFVKRGYKTCNWSYASNRFSIKELGKQLKELIDKTPMTTIHFVGHSMGGIVIRSYMDQFKPTNVGRVVMIGTPNSGASIASLFSDYELFKKSFGPAAIELASDSQKGLAQPADFPNTEFAVIAGGTGTKYGMNPLIKGDNDGLVATEEAKLKGAKCFTIVPLHHMIIHLEKSTIQKTANFIEFGSFDTPGNTSKSNE